MTILLRLPAELYTMICQYLGSDLLYLRLTSKHANSIILPMILTQYFETRCLLLTQTGLRLKNLVEISRYEIFRDALKTLKICDKPLRSKPFNIIEDRMGYPYQMLDVQDVSVQHPSIVTTAPREGLTASKVSMLMSTFPRIERLELVFYQQDCFSYIAQNFKLPKITSLYLQGIECCGDKLVEFLLDHKELKDVDLYSIRILGGEKGWQSFLVRVRDELSISLTIQSCQSGIGDDLYCEIDYGGLLKFAGTYEEWTAAIRAACCNESL